MQERKKETHLAAGCGPEVDAGAEADGEHVLRGPVDEVQVEVVLQGRRVQHLHGGDDDTSVSTPRSENSVHARCLRKSAGGSNLVGRLGDLAGRLLGGGGAAAAGAVQLLGEGRGGRGGAVRLEAEEVVGAGGVLPVAAGGGVTPEELGAEEARVGAAVVPGAGAGGGAVGEREVVEAGGGPAGDEAVAVGRLGRGRRLGDLEQAGRRRGGGGRGRGGGVQAERPRHPRRHVEPPRLGPRGRAGCRRRHGDRTDLRCSLASAAPPLDPADQDAGFGSGVTGGEGGGVGGWRR